MTVRLAVDLLTRRWLAVGVVMAVTVSVDAAGSYPAEAVNLRWRDKSQVLTYRSCGCADSCWVAELRMRRTKKLKAKLRSDCVRLLYSSATLRDEAVLPMPASTINDRDDKMEAIVGLMDDLFNSKAARPIGSVRMLPDRTIVMELRAESGSAVGDARFVYKRGDVHYDEILRHVGGLTPGEEKQVLPFPDSK